MNINVTPLISNKGRGGVIFKGTLSAAGENLEKSETFEYYPPPLFFPLRQQVGDLIKKSGRRPEIFEVLGVLSTAETLGNGVSLKEKLLWGISKPKKSPAAAFDT